MVDAPSRTPPQFRTKGPQRQKRLYPVASYLDFRPGIDAVVRRGDRCFLVDTWHQYADIEIMSDKLTPEQIVWYGTLSGQQREKMTLATWGTCLLSFQGKMERLDAMDVKLVFTASW